MTPLLIAGFARPLIILKCNPIPFDNLSNSSALLLARVQGSALWMIPAIVITGAGITIFRLRKKKQD